MRREAYIDEVVDLVGRIGAILAGHRPEVIGAALCDLHATLLAGHQGEGVAELREEMLQAHVKTVRRLIPINEKEMLLRLHPYSH